MANHRRYVLHRSVDHPLRVNVEETQWFLEVDGIDLQMIRLPKDPACLDALAELLDLLIRESGGVCCLRSNPAA